MMVVDNYNDGGIPFARYIVPGTYLVKRVDVEEVSYQEGAESQYEKQFIGIGKH